MTFIELVVDNMLIEVQLLASFNLLLGVVYPLIYDLWGLGSSLLESLLKSLDTGSVNEDVVAVDIVVVDFLASLNIDVHDAYLPTINNTFPLFMMSISLPLCVP